MTRYQVLATGPVAALTAAVLIAGCSGGGGGSGAAAGTSADAGSPLTSQSAAPDDDATRPVPAGEAGEEADADGATFGPVENGVTQPSPASSQAVAALAQQPMSDQYVQYQATMYDIDANGVFDPYVADYNQNGVLDQNLVATTDGVLVWLFDVNENAWPDQYGGDTNWDGVPDLWLLDDNEDTVMDQVQYDPAVHLPANVPQGGLAITIGHGDIPVDPPGMAAAVDGLLLGNGGDSSSMDICTWLASAAMAGSNLTCVV